MIQRIQSIYLLLAAAVLGSQFVLPYASAPAGSVPDPDGTFTDGVFNVLDRPGMLLFTATAGILALVAIFLYKNRNIQSRLTSIGTIVAALLAITLATQFYSLINDAGPSMSFVHYQGGVGMPGLSILLLWLANRAIRKDEALVRSSDRLR